MNLAALNEFDRQTIQYLRAAGVDELLIARVFAAMTTPMPAEVSQ